MSSEHEQWLARRLLVTFKGEASERIGALSQGMAALQAGAIPAGDRLLEAMFRDAHSLKAAARSVGQKEIEILCQALESVFAAVKRGACSLPPILLAALRAACDAMEDSLATIDGAPSPGQIARATALAQEVDQC